MKTSNHHGPDYLGLTARGVVWLLCLTLVAASGCAGCETLKAPFSPAKASAVLPITPCGPGCTPPVEHAMGKCDFGDCDTSSGNGNGLYVKEQGNYCFLFNGEETYCPAAFINTPTGVMLEFRYNKQPGKTLPQNTVSAVKSRMFASSQEVTVRSFSGEKSQLTLHYNLKNQPGDYSATGPALSDFTFQVTVDMLDGGGSGDVKTSEPVTYKFKIEEDASKKGVLPHARYTLRYQDTSTPNQPWLWHCQQAEKEPQEDSFVSFLPGERVGIKSGFARQDKDALTMACQTGAIVTCLSWGYTPWASTGQFDPDRDYTYRSCLQAKRAAYFIGQGDLKSYTFSGTQIFRRDHHGYGNLQSTLPPDIEAIWNPRGVVCINPDLLRHRQFRDSVGKSVKGKIPPCTTADWGLNGTLATGAEDPKLW